MVTTRLKKVYPLAAATAIALSAALAGSAAAAVVGDRPCYREGVRATFLGNGFQPGQQVAVSLDGRQIGLQRADASGSVLGSIQSLTPIPSSELQRSLTMTQVTNTALTGTARFIVTKLYVVTKPPRFRPGRKLRIRAGGFYGAGPVLYAHVRGRKKRNLRIGTVAGPCGKVSATKKVILKRRDPVGLYPTQFDTSRKYIGAAALPRFEKLYAIRRVPRLSRTSSLALSALGPELWVPGAAGHD